MSLYVFDDLTVFRKNSFVEQLIIVLVNISVILNN